MTKPTTKTAWLKELRTGEDGSAWRVGAEIIDDEMKSARKLLDKAELPYTARDLVRLTEVIFKAMALPKGIAALAKARLDCEGIPYGASDLIEMIALLIDCIACLADAMEQEHHKVCAGGSGQVRH